MERKELAKKYKYLQRIIWAASMIWALVVLVQSIPYYQSISAGKQSFKAGLYDQAEQHFKSALKTAESFHSQDSRLANSLNNLAELYRTQARYADAEPIYKRLLSVAEKSWWQKDIGIAISHHNLASLYRDECKDDEALQESNLALSIWNEKVKRPNDAIKASLLNGLAKTYRDKGDYVQSEKLALEALAIKENALGKDHIEVAAVLDNLGGIYRDEHKYGDAEVAYQRAFAIDKASWGLDHPDTIGDLNNLGELFCDEGKYTDAEPLLRDALAKRQKIFGPNHPLIATSLYDLGIVYKDTKRKDQARPLLEQSLAIRQKMLGPNHRDTKESQQALESLSKNTRVLGTKH